MTDTIKNAAPNAKAIFVQETTAKGADHRTWFRGETQNFNPNFARMLQRSVDGKFVVDGWAPETPRISESTRITAFGSCFAQNISKWLADRQYNVRTKDSDAADAYVISMGEGMVNSFVIRQQFEWAWEGKVFNQELWHGYDAKSYGYDEQVRLTTKKVFDETDTFILTFGLSEVWYDEPTDNVFWRTIPKDVYDPGRHKFRVSSVTENADNMRAIYALIRKHRPDAKIIFTLSPVPLIATFREVSCISANAVSKSILRVAMDEVLREVGHEGVLHYWPSYEIVTDVFDRSMLADRRHPKRDVLDYIMTLFEHVWCTGDPQSKPCLVEAWLKAHASTDSVPPIVRRLLRKRTLRFMTYVLEQEQIMEDPKEDAALRVLLKALEAQWQIEFAARDAAAT